MKNTLKLKKNYEFRSTIKRGNYYSSEFIECFYLKNKKNYNSIGIAIKTKLCKAVKRNRIKRIIRAVYTELEDDINSGNVFVFLWKKNVNIEECTYNNVLQDMKKIFKKIGIWNNE